MAGIDLDAELAAVIRDFSDDDLLGIETYSAEVRDRLAERRPQIARLYAVLTALAIRERNRRRRVEREIRQDLDGSAWWGSPDDLPPDP